MERKDFLKSIIGLGAIPAIAKSEIVEMDKPKLLILSFEDYLDPDTHQAIRESLKYHLPGWKVLILDGGATFEVRDV